MNQERERRRTEPGDISPPVGPVEVLVFLAELALLAASAVAGARLGQGVVAVILAVALPLAAATLWGVKLAPKAILRLRFPARLVAKLALALAAGILLAVSGKPVWAVLFLAFASVLFTAGELRERSHARRV